MSTQPIRLTRAGELRAFVGFAVQPLVAAAVACLIIGAAFSRSNRLSSFYRRFA